VLAQEETERLIAARAKLARERLQRESAKSREQQLKAQKRMFPEENYDSEATNECSMNFSLRIGQEENKKRKEMMEIFIQAEERARWVPIESPYPTAARFVEFCMGRASRMRPKTQLQQQLVNCALCEKSFSKGSVTTVVSRKALYDLRESWDPSNERFKALRRKFRFRMYDQLRVCTFCAHLLESRAEKPCCHENPKEAKQQKAKPTIIVAIIDDARLDDLGTDCKSEELRLPQPPSHKRPPSFPSPIRPRSGALLKPRSARSCVTHY